MNGKWRVARQDIVVTIYGVYRLRDANNVNNNSNREYTDYIYYEEQGAQMLADHLNGGDNNA